MNMEWRPDRSEYLPYQGGELVLDEDGVRLRPWLIPGATHAFPSGNAYSLGRLLRTAL